jgi:hypothetical protein
MRYLVLASVLLIAIGAAAQNSPRPTDESGRCFSIVTYHVKPSEHIAQHATMRQAITTCTPANRFRAEYIPNAVLHRDVVPASCLGCSLVVPNAQAYPAAPNVLREDGKPHRRSIQ